MNSIRRQQIQFLSFPSKLLKPKSFPSFSSSSIIIESSSSSSSSLNPEPKNVLTQQEITKINLLIPRLCLSNNTNVAVHLIFTALLTNPPPKSLPFSILIHSLTSQPDLALPMTLLTKLKHTPQTLSSLTPITTLLISSYLKKGRPKDALKVYNWMLRPGSPCKVEKIVGHVLIDGLCRYELIIEGLRVLRDMLGLNLVVKGGLRKRVFMSLLREARIKEAKEVDEALKCVENGEDEAVKKALSLLDDMIANWTE